MIQAKHESAIEDLLLRAPHTMRLWAERNVASASPARGKMQDECMSKIETTWITAKAKASVHPSLRAPANNLASTIARASSASVTSRRQNSHCAPRVRISKAPRDFFASEIARAEFGRSYRLARQDVELCPANISDGPAAVRRAAKRRQANGNGRK